jgi:hypothetical protein
MTGPGRWRMRALAVVCAIAAALGAGCAEPPAAPSPRPLTEAEAEALAVARFGNYRAGGLHITATVSSAAGPLRLAGDLDTRAHVGYAAVAYADATSGTGQGTVRRGVAVLRWDPATVDTWLGVGDGHAPPSTLPAEPPQRRALRAGEATLDTVLLLLIGLSSDRPENPLLLRQSDARWLRADTLDGTPVDVLRGPSATPERAQLGGSLRYWLDPAGRLLRVEAEPPDATATVDLDPDRYVPVPRPASPG